MHTASHLSSDPSKLGTAAQTAAVRRKHYAEELPLLLLHDRYMFGYVRERWINSVKITFPHASFRASAAHGELNGERFPRHRPPSSRHRLSQFEKVAAAVVPCPTWGQSSWSQRQFGLITKKLPLLPQKRQCRCRILERLPNERHYRQILAGGRRDGWKPVDREEQYQSLCWGNPLKMLLKQTATANGTVANNTRVIRHSRRREKGKRLNRSDQHELEPWHRANMWRAVWKLRTKQKAWNKTKLKICFYFKLLR